jgi:hypothetical protein
MPGGQVIVSAQPRYIAFLINLIQDVAIFAPLIELAQKMGGAKVLILHTRDFVQRDASKLWSAELHKIAASANAKLVEVEQARDALIALQDKRGLLLSASETDLPQHQLANDIVRGCPSSFVTISVQHGFENIGLLHNDAHDDFFGGDIGFGSDIVAAWFKEDRLYSIKPSERAKLFVTGPPMMLSLHPRAGVPVTVAGLICENLHSVRMRGQGTQANFLAILAEAAVGGAAAGISFEVRPHPGGQYLRRQGIKLPDCVSINTDPLYRQDLSRFRFGISAPSSVLLDLILADVPVAVWQSEAGSLALGNYSGLPVVSDAADWLRFAEESERDRMTLLERQRQFVDSLGIPADVEERFRRLLSIDINIVR